MCLAIGTSLSTNLQPLLSLTSSRGHVLQEAPRLLKAVLLRLATGSSLPQPKRLGKFPDQKTFENFLLDVLLGH